MNTSCNDLLYMDLKVGAEQLGRLFIEPLGQATDNFLVATLKFLLNNITSTEEVGHVVRVERLQSVSFAWSSEVKNAFVQYCIAHGATNLTIPYPLSHSVIRDLDLTAKEQIAFVGLSKERLEDCNLPQVVILTTHWGAVTFPGPLVGRVFKGTDLILHIASLNVNKNKQPLDYCTIQSVGIVQPECSLNLRNRDALTDIYSDSPCSSGITSWEPSKVMTVVNAIKSSGSFLFRQEKYHMAIYRFSKAIRFINTACAYCRPDREWESRYFCLVVSCILNSAACKIKLKDFNGALEDCNEAVELDPSNPKIYYRRGQAYHGKLCYERSLFDLFTALRLSPHDRAIKNEIAAVTGAIQVYKKKRKGQQSVAQQ